MAIRYLPVFPDKSSEADNIILSVISLNLVKTHLRVQYDDDDDYISMLIRNAVDIANQFCGKSMIPGLRYFRSNIIEESFRIHDDVYQIESISYLNDQDETVSIDLNEVELSPVNDYFELKLNNIPEDANETNAQFRVMYQFGKQNPEDFVLPGAVLQAILLIIGEFYEYREDRVWSIPRASERLLESFREQSF